MVRMVLPVSFSLGSASTEDCVMDAITWSCNYINKKYYWFWSFKRTIYFTVYDMSFRASSQSKHLY